MAMVRCRLDPMTHMPLPMQQLKTLLLVCAGRSMTSSGLAEELGVGPATMTGLTDRLAERGLVRRVSVPGDRRVRLVEPTDAGQDLVRAVTGFDHGHMADIVDRLDDDELAALATGIAAVRRAVESLGDGGSTDR